MAIKSIVSHITNKYANQQFQIYEGRERCRELIQELKHSCGLLQEENAELHDYKLDIKLQQREEQIATEKVVI